MIARADASLCKVGAKHRRASREEPPGIAVDFNVERSAIAFLRDPADHPPVLDPLQRAAIAAQAMEQ
ncbi:hypothetical protein [Thioclava sp. ES.031]|uniref:hypothetical protein n=1 Tax=Thioclava sp. ES.031 TaxID=1798203 RepID=UPI000BF63BAD|nr:hypothetical protein [Thioclava sp. ES.031]